MTAGARLRGVKRPLLLNGFMATGKSTVGRLVAQTTGLPFVDLDSRIESRAGRSISEIFERDGEAGFRRLEAAELDRVLEEPPAVVALGGGALLRRPLRLRAIERAVVVTLRASAQALLERTRNDTRRPLLAAPDADSRLERISTLLEARRDAYTECHAAIDTERASPQEIRDAVVAVWQRDPIGVAAGERSYAVDVGVDIAQSRLPRLVKHASRRLLVTDNVVAPLHADPIRQVLADTGPTSDTVLPAGEQHKAVPALEQIWTAARTASVDRKSMIVGLGGGVVTDVAGFAAATWMRGISWVGIPTTLLAMVDASTGGKTAIDFGEAKNAVGAFWQPHGVICDVSFLNTEGQRNFTSALAEVVKTAIIGDPELLDRIEDNIQPVLDRDPEIVHELVRRSVVVKAGIVSRDEREGGLRATLNLGHTVGHALEAEGGYGRLTHGEAISLGLVAAVRIGVRLGATPQPLAQRTEQVLSALGLPVDLQSQPLAAAIRLIGHDKKRAGTHLGFVVARAPGRVEVERLPLSEIEAHAAAIA